MTSSYFYYLGNYDFKIFNALLDLCCSDRCRKDSTSKTVLVFLFWHKNRWGVTKSIKKAFIYTYSTQLLICMGQHGWWFQSVPWAVAKPSVATNGIWCMFGWLKALQRLKRNCVRVCVFTGHERAWGFAFWYWMAHGRIQSNERARSLRHLFF